MEGNQNIASCNFDPTIWKELRLSVKNGNQFRVHFLVNIDRVKSYVMERVFMKLANEATEFDQLLGSVLTQVEVTDNKF